MAHPLVKLAQQLDPSATLTYNPPRITSSNGAVYYAKLGTPSEQPNYTAEVASLNAIHDAAPGLAPRVLLSGTLEDTSQPYMISEYKDLTSLSGPAAKRLATRLATEMHRYKSPSGMFGFEVPTFCGPTKQSNGWSGTWTECYSQLIGGLLEGLRERGYKEVCEKGEEVVKSVIPFLLDPLDIEPVLLHGDLWSGNTGTDASGEPVIFDPSSYYGHNEADLAIARIFGGFSSSFFETYHKHLPKSEPVNQYELRVDLYELYHYLNHALIFGGSGYSSSALQKMNRLLRYCSK